MDLADLAKVLNALRQSFPTVPLFCIPWMNVRHPLHPAQEELLGGEPSERRLEDTEGRQGWVVSLVRRLAASNSLALRAVLCVTNAVRLSVKVVQLKSEFRREIDALRATGFQMIAKTWCFGSDRLPDDRDFYYGDLQKRLADQSIRMLLICGDANDSDWRTFAKAQISTRQAFRLPDFCLAPNFSPIWTASLQLATALKLRRHTKSASDSLTKRASGRASLDILHPAVTQTSLLFHIAKEAVKTWNPVAFITLYEGHGWEKTAWWGAKSENPDCRTVGYQHTTLFPVTLSMLEPFVDERERSVPDVVLALGSETAAMLDAGHRAYGVQTVRFGTFRRHESHVTAPADPARRTILVIPEGIISEMESMFRFASRCARVMPLYQFILRAHPKWLGTKLLREIIDSLSTEQNMTFSHDSIDEDFGKASAMLYRGSSAVLYGTLNGLLPVYLRLPDTAISDPIEHLSVWRQTCQSPDDLVRKLDRYENLAAEQRNADWRSAVEYVRNYVPPVNEQSILDFLQAVGSARGAQPCTA